MKVRFSIFILLFFCSGATAPSAAVVPAPQTKALDQYSVNETLSSLSLEEKVGQLFMIGIENKNLSKVTKNLYKKMKPGFVVLFKKNISTPSQTLSLTQESESYFDSLSMLRPIFTVDQEGGDVVRIPTSPPLPTALAVGELKEPSLSRELGKNIGDVLRRLHIYMNLAPVLDLTEYVPSSFIQTRSYGPNPQDVYTNAKYFVEGLEQNKILSTAKHFPGIGLTSNDSHKSISIAELSEEDLLSSLEPYKRLVRDSSLDAVMMTHHIYKNIDSVPATYSKKIISLLRTKFGFTGLIITDDVEMAGAKVFKSVEERAVQAFLSGNDVIMVAWNRSSQVRAYNGILDAVRKGVISLERLNESIERIIKAKLKTPLFENQTSTKEDFLLSLRNSSLKNVIDEILDKKVSQEFSRLSIKLPINKNFVVASSDGEFIKNFSNQIPSRKIVLSASSNAKNINLKKNEFLIFHVSGPKSFLILNQLMKKNVSKSLLIINSRFRGLIDPRAPALHVQLKHPLLGAAIAQRLAAKNLRSISKEN